MSELRQIAALYREHGELVNRMFDGTGGLYDVRRLKVVRELLHRHQKGREKLYGQKLGLNICDEVPHE